LADDYDQHAPLATGFLDGLGATELARINEKFAASLATQLQQLTDRGLYSSAVSVDITARNTRDRNEEVVALNDRLNREQFENQHKLYAEQAGMRDRTMTGRDRMHGVEQDVRGSHVSQITNRFGLQQSARDRTMSGQDRSHAVFQGVYGWKASQITSVYQLEQANRDRTLSAQTALHGLRDANVRLGMDTKMRLYAAGEAIKRLVIEEAGRLHQLRQAITGWKTTQRDTLLQQVQAIKGEFRP
ncbi:unnamed protein product, partial [marine sediment metagenome]